MALPDNINPNENPVNRTPLGPPSPYWGGTSKTDVDVLFETVTYLHSINDRLTALEEKFGKMDVTTNAIGDLVNSMEETTDSIEYKLTSIEDRITSIEGKLP